MVGGHGGTAAGHKKMIALYVKKVLPVHCFDEKVPLRCFFVVQSIEFPAFCSGAGGRAKIIYINPIKQFNRGIFFPVSGSKPGLFYLKNSIP